MLALLVVVASATVACCQQLQDAVHVPPPVDAETQQELELHQLNLLLNAHDTRATFRSKWVSQSTIYNSKPSGVATLEVVATDKVTDYGWSLTAQIVQKMLANMHPTIYNSLISNGNAFGVFSRLDAGGPTVFPAFAPYADRPECYGKCSGSCANTCTFDGRKYTTLAGLGGTFSAVLESTVLCDQYDPYYGKLNVAVHEYAHGVHYGVYSLRSPFNSGTTFGTQIYSAYNNAKSRNIWEANSYAMATEYEYFAEGTGVYFNTDQTASAGGMNKCDNYNVGSCATEAAGRYRISQKDPQLYNALTEIWVNRDPNKASGLKTCMK